VETALKGKRFQDVEHINKKNVTAELNAVHLESFTGFSKTF
jgi:K+-sensing histidine kinase KdpD